MYRSLDRSRAGDSSFDALTVRAKEEYELVKTDEIQPILEDRGRVRNYPLFPDDENRRFLTQRYQRLDERC